MSQVKPKTLSKRILSIFGKRQFSKSDIEDNKIPAGNNMDIEIDNDLCLSEEELSDIIEDSDSSPKFLKTEFIENIFTTIDVDEESTDIIENGAKTIKDIKADKRTKVSKVEKTINRPSSQYQVYNVGDFIEDRFQVEKRFEGGMGYVYIARDFEQNIFFAIKQPQEIMIRDEKYFRRVIKEAEAWTLLGMHPNIAYCYFVRRINGIPCIFVEYVDGGNLSDWMAEGKCRELKDGLDWAIQFCHGMELAHSRGMIHRDIKPMNILMTKEGVLKITDFGLVGITQEVSGDFRQVNPDSIETGCSTILGTPKYMAPEQWHDARKRSHGNPNGVWYDSDVFSFGVVLWELLCQNRPFHLTNEARSRTIPHPKTLRSDIPDILADILLKCIDLQREKRFQSFATVRIALNEVYREVFHLDAPNFKVNLVDTVPDEINNQGYSYFEIGSYNLAEECFKDALKRDQIHPQATNNLSLMEWRQGKITDEVVVKRLENCIKNPTNRKKGKELLAYIHAERFDLLSAKRMLDELSVSSDEKLDSDIFSSLVLVSTLKGHKGEVNSALIDSNNEYVFSGGDDKRIIVWNLRNSICERVIEHDFESVKSLALSPENNLLISGSDKKRLRRWDIATGETSIMKEGEFIMDFNTIGISPDGRHVLYTGGVEANRILYLLDIKDDKKIISLEGHERGINTLSISNNGKICATGGYDGKVNVWNLQKRNLLRVLTGNQGEIKAVAVNPTGDFVLSAGKDMKIKVWNSSSGSCMRELIGHQNEITSICYYPRGSYAISGSNQGNIRLWDLKTGVCISTVKAHSNAINSLFFSPTIGNCFASASSDTLVKLWSFLPKRQFRANMSLCGLRQYESRKEEDNLIKQEVEELSRIFAEGRFQESKEKLFEVWDKIKFRDHEEILEVYANLLEKGKKKSLNFYYEIELHGDIGSIITSLTFSPDDKQIITGSSEQEFQIWDIGKRMLTESFDAKKVAPQEMTVLDIVSDHDVFNITHSMQSKFKEWEKALGIQIRTEKRNAMDVNFCVAVPVKSSQVLTGLKDSSILYCNTENKQCILELRGHQNAINCLDVSFDGEIAVSGGEDYRISLWNLLTGKRIAVFSGHSGPVMSVSISRDKKYVISGGWDSTAMVWDTRNFKCIRRLNGHSNVVSSVAMGFDYRLALTGSWDNTLRLWDLYSGRCLHVLEGHKKPVTSVGLSPESRFAISGSYDKSVKIWNLSTGTCTKNLSGDFTVLNSVAISRNGIYAAAGSPLHVWRLIWELDFCPEDVS